MATETTKKVLTEMLVRHHEWMKRTAKSLNIYEKEVLAAVFNHAIEAGVMEKYKSHVAVNQLQKTLDDLAKGAKDIVALKEKGEELIRRMADGKE